MSETSKKATADARKLEKTERKSANVAKVEETKRKTMWDTLADDKKGIVAKKDGDESKPEPKRFKTQKVQTKNRISHRRGHGKMDAKVCVKSGGRIVRVSRNQAVDLVAKGGTYVNKTAWREQKVEAA